MMPDRHMREEDDLPEELLDYEDDLRFVGLDREAEDDDGEEHDVWMEAQRERRMRRLRGRKGDTTDWVADAFGAFLAARGPADSKPRRRRRR